MGELHDDLVAHLEPRRGERWLDVACGTGAVAARAARAGADVTGCDFAEGLIERARRLAAAEDLEIRFDVADAESLPYEDASFDVVASAVGVIFAPDHAAVARELARVCRPGGRLGLVAWRAATLFRSVTAKYQPPPEPGAGDSEDWGREEYAERLLGEAFELAFLSRRMYMRGESGEEVWTLLGESVGVFRALQASLDPARREELHRDFVEHLEAHRDENGIALPGDYLLILGTRRS